jgi:ribosome-associated translation inhibitor RaiA/cold shock CspA family protein
MDIHIDTQHFDIYDELRATITSSLEKLNARHDDIIHARVTLVKSTHHQHGSDEARFMLSMARRKLIQASKIGKDVDDAIHNALQALTRELSDFRSKRRGLDKQRLKAAKSGPRLSGQVVHVAPEQGYGYVDIGADEEIHFLRNVVVGDAFEMINEGAAVEVDVVESDSGYEATRVALLQS